MKKVQVDNIWPRTVIETSSGIGRVLRVQNLWGNKDIAEILFSWHQDDVKSITMAWDDTVSVLDADELTDLFE